MAEHFATTFKTGQKVTHHSLDTVADRTVQYHIQRDVSYPFQSVAKVEVWTDNGWALVSHLHFAVWTGITGPVRGVPQWDTPAWDAGMDYAYGELSLRAWSILT